MPVLYIVFVLIGYLIDEIIHKEKKKHVDPRRHEYKDDYISQEYRIQKKREGFKIIR